MTTFHMIIGLPYSGMFEYARKVQNEDMAVIHYDISDTMIDDIEAGRNVILVTSETMTHKYRRKVFAKINDFEGIEITATLIASPFSDCLNRQRHESMLEDCPAKEDKMRKMRENYVPPCWEEGFHNVWIAWNVEYFPWYSTELLFIEMNKFEQDNEHHEFTLGNHMLKAYEFISRDESVRDLLDPVAIATAFHDIGKLETKRFSKMNGEPTKDAHYYGHEGVGAYNAMFYMANDGYVDDEMILDTCLLIALHMRPYFATSKKAISRMIRRFGEGVWEKLQMINEADRAAH